MLVTKLVFNEEELSALFIFLLPFHHVITAGGLDPVAWHNNFTLFPAETGFFFETIFTSSGLTAKGNIVVSFTLHSTRISFEQHFSTWSINQVLSSNILLTANRCISIQMHYIIQGPISFAIAVAVI